MPKRFDSKLKDYNWLIADASQALDRDPELLRKWVRAGEIAVKELNARVQLLSESSARAADRNHTRRSDS